MSSNELDSNVIASTGTNSIVDAYIEMEGRVLLDSLGSSVRVAELGSSMKVVRCPKGVRETIVDKSHEEIELIVHGLHNVLDDNGADGIVDYAVLEIQLKMVIDTLVDRLKVSS